MKKSQLRQIIKEEIKKVFEAEEGIPSDDPLAEIPAVEAPTPPEPSGEIDLETAKRLVFDTKGKIFTVVFIKKDGTERTMNARLGVKKYLRGGSLRYDAKEMGLIPVYDIQAKGYRMVNSNTIKRLKIGGKEYNIPTAISETREEHEMIVEYRDL